MARGVFGDGWLAVGELKSIGINIYCLCLGAFVAILSGLSGLGFRIMVFGACAERNTQNTKHRCCSWGANRRRRI
jgi:hypothetical protein